MVLSNIFESLKVILKEKEDKVGPYYSQYKTWWLALIDHIGFGLGQTEKEELKIALLNKHSFHKIIFISPLNPEDGFEL